MPAASGALKPSVAVEQTEPAEHTVEELTAEVSEHITAEKAPPAIPPPHFGDEHDRGCDRVREALGMRRRHMKGVSESTHVMSADLSGPHPEAVGTHFTYMVVAVF